ncbi:MAG: glucokinase [Gammaproteobacteria bacterium]
MDYQSYADGPRVLADIGGTNARFALELAAGQIAHIVNFACADYPRFEDALAAYLEHVLDHVCTQAPHQQGRRPRHAVIAIANPVSGDAVRMTNHHWAFSIAAAREALDLETLLVVNDFAALAMALPALDAADLRQVGGGRATPDAVIGLLGAGTGLGVAGLIPAGGRYIPLQSEGGHVALSPSDAREVSVLQYAWRRYRHVSAERLVSGPGLSLIHEALSFEAGQWTESALPAPVIVERGLAGTDALCRATLDCFCALLGTVAGNLAVTLSARGGIFIGGGIVPRLGAYFAESQFRSRFENKGRFSEFNAQIPTLVITAPNPALSGAAALLAEHLAERADKPLLFGRTAAVPGSSSTQPITAPSDPIETEKQS